MAFRKTVKITPNDIAIGFGHSRIHYRRIFWNFYWEREDATFWPTLRFNPHRSKSLKNMKTHGNTTWDKFEKDIADAFEQPETAADLRKQMAQEAASTEKTE